MPAALPSTSAYTYAAEVNADEALALGSRHIEFSKPVPIYVDNFLSIPVGSAVPLGSYNKIKGAWEAELDGVVLKILSITNGVARISVSRSLAPATNQELTALGMDTAELTKLAAIYPVGKELTRVALNRFSPIDPNYVRLFSASNIPKRPPYLDSPDPYKNKCGNGTKVPGCVISLVDRNVSEDLDLVGVPFDLHYDTGRTSGNLSDKKIKIPLIPETGTIINISEVKVDIEVAGRKFKQVFNQIRNGLATEFIWDGKDSLDRQVGMATAKVTLSYKDVAPQIAVSSWSTTPTRSFGSSVGVVGATMVTMPAREGGEESASTFSVQLGRASNERYLRQSFGGWTPSIHHSYNPITRSLLLGSGESYFDSEVSKIVTTFAGVGTPGFSGDNGPALSAQFRQIGAMAKGPDGSIYVVDEGNFRIRRIAPDGTVSTVVGTGVAGDSGDGGLASQAQIRGSAKPAIGPDSTIYFSDTQSNRIRKVSPLGMISTVVGTGVSGSSVDGTAATQAAISAPGDIQMDREGTLYFMELGAQKIRRVLSNGTIDTIRTGMTGKLAMLQNDQIYYGVNTIRRYATLTGSSNLDPQQYIGAAVRSIDINESGELVLVDSGRIMSSGDPSITGSFGSPLTGYNTGDYEDYTRKSAWEAKFSDASSAIWLNDGSILIADRGANKIRKYSSSLPSLNANGYTIPSADGSELFQFNAQGVHLQTLFAKTGAVKWLFAYDSNGGLIKITDRLGKETIIARASNGNPLSITGPYGQMTQLSTDSNGYLSSVTNANGETYTIGYTPSGLMSSFRKPRGGTSTYLYDELGGLKEETNAAGKVQTLAVSEDPNNSSQKGLTTITTLTSPLGRKSNLRLDYLLQTGTDTVTGEGQFIRSSTSENDPYPTEILAMKDGYLEERLFGGQMMVGSTQQVDSRMGGLATFLGDRKVNRYGGIGGTSLMKRNRSYSSTGPTFFDFSMNEKTFVNGKLWEKNYSSLTKTTTSISPMGRQTHTKIDQLERPIEFGIGSLNPITFGYDGGGRIGSLTVGDRQTQFGYNSRGQLSTITDAIGRVTSYEYDLAGRVTKQTMPGGREFLVSYDSDGNISGLTPPGRSAHQMPFNLLGQLIGYISPSAGGQNNQTAYTYDFDQQISTVTRPSGEVLTYSYDLLGSPKNLPVKLEHSGGEISYIYQANRPNYMTANSTDYSEYSQDGFLFNGDLLTYKSTSLNGDSFPVASYHLVNFTHTLEGNLDSIAIQGLDTISYSYDNDQLVSGTDRMTVARSPSDGLIVGTTLGNTTTVMTRNLFGEPNLVETRVGSTLLLRESIVRDKLGRVATKTVTTSSGTKTYIYDYDLAGRLWRVRENGSLIGEYTYDLNGNRMTSTVRGTSANATYDSQDRLLTRGPASFGYNANGDMIRKSVGSAISNLTYNGLGQLKRVQLPNANRVSYLYDSLGNRVLSNLNDQPSKKYIYSNIDQVIAEVDASGATSQFIYVTRSHAPDYMLRNGVTYRLVQDHIGSVRMVVNAATGAISQQVEYDEFGNILSDSNPTFQPFRFAGCLYDLNTKLCRFGARDYDPEIGRWTSKDPIMFRGGSANIYSYSANDPVNYIDPSGLKVYDVDNIVPDKIKTTSLYRQLDSLPNEIFIISDQLAADESGTTLSRDNAALQLIKIDLDHQLSSDDLEDTFLHELNHADQNIKLGQPDLSNMYLRELFDTKFRLPIVKDRERKKCQ